MPPLEKRKSREPNGKPPRGGTALPGYTPAWTLMRLCTGHRLWNAPSSEPRNHFSGK